MTINTKAIRQARYEGRPQSAWPINCEELTPEQIREKYETRCRRTGKTQARRNRLKGDSK